jgi:hypothetical protein
MGHLQCSTQSGRLRSDAHLAEQRFPASEVLPQSFEHAHTGCHSWPSACALLERQMLLSSALQRRPVPKPCTCSVHVRAQFEPNSKISVRNHTVGSTGVICTTASKASQRISAATAASAHSKVHLSCMRWSKHQLNAQTQSYAPCRMLSWPLHIALERAVAPMAHTSNSRSSSPIAGVKHVQHV